MKCCQHSVHPTPPNRRRACARLWPRGADERDLNAIEDSLPASPPTRWEPFKKNSGLKNTPQIRRRRIDAFDLEVVTAGTPALRSELARAPGTRSAAARQPTGVNAQIDQVLQKNWTQARALGLNPPNISVNQFVRQTQSTVGEPKPTVARVLAAVQTLSKKDVLITPNLAADEIIEKDELR
jgi:hypothetical protein